VKELVIGPIDKRATSVNSWVAVINYDDYQDSDKQPTSEGTADGTDTGTPNHISLTCLPGVPERR